MYYECECGSDCPFCENCNRPQCECKCDSLCSDSEENTDESEW